MHLTTKVRYAVRSMAELALEDPSTAVALRDLAERQGISAKYLEQIIRDLRLAGLVKSVRGALGGYGLTRPPAEISVREIFEAVEGAASLTECVADPDCCPEHKLCATREIWVEMTESLTRILESKTLQDIADKLRKGAVRKV